MIGKTSNKIIEVEYFINNLLSYIILDFLPCFYLSDKAVDRKGTVGIAVRKAISS